MTRLLRVPQRSYMTLILTLIVFLSAVISIIAVCPPNTLISKKSDALLRFSNADPSSHTYVQMKAVEESMAKLSALKGSIAVVAVAGPARTGKSYFVNKLLPIEAIADNNNDNFKVGHTVQTQTQDVDMQIIPGCALTEYGLKDSDLTVIFLDTPGFYATDRALIFDSQLMALLNLISSIVVYNTKDILLQNSLQQLSDAIDAAFALSYMESTEDKLTKNRKRLDRPHFVWVQQQATLQLKGHDGKVITPKQFIEEVLEEADVASNKTTQHAERFHNFFQSVDGTLLPHPTEYTEDLKDLSKFAWANLTKEYRASIIDLRKQLMGKLEAKKLDNEKINGEVLATLITEWIRTMELPESELQTRDPRALLNKIVEAEVEKAKNQYIRRMEAKYSADKLPQDSSALEKDHRDAVKEINRGKEGMAAYIQRFTQITDALYETYLNDNTFQLHGRAQATVRGKFKPWWEKYQKELEGMTMPFSEEDYHTLDQKMNEEWGKIEESLSKFEKDSQLNGIPKYKTDETSAYLEKKKKENDAIAAQQCENRAKKVAAYYDNLSWFTTTQSAADFNKMVDLLNRPMIKNQRESIINELRPLLPSPLSPLLQTTGKLVCITQGGADSPRVFAAYDLARDSFNSGLRVRVVFASILTLAAYGLSVFVFFRLPTLYTAYNANLADAKRADDEEGNKVYIYTFFAVWSALVYYIVSDAIYHEGLHFIALFVLTSASILSWRLRMRIEEILKKSGYSKV